MIREHNKVLNVTLHPLSRSPMVAIPIRAYLLSTNQDFKMAFIGNDEIKE